MNQKSAHRRPECSGYHSGLHLYSLFTAGATLILIVAGALVTSNDAGLAAPDWPLSYGQVFPKMVGNLLYEHSHRLIATSVGLLTIGLNIWLWKTEQRRWVRRVGLAALGAVVAQGILGGITVLFYLPLAISASHACLAQIFFCLTVGVAVFTSRSWLAERDVADDPSVPPLRYRCSLACVMILAQLILGAVLRHSAPWDQYPPSSLLFAHVTGAIVVTLTLAWVVASVYRAHGSDPYLTKPALVVAALLIAQLSAGVAAYVTRMASPNEPQPLDPMISVTVAHVALGALTLAVTFVLTLRVFKSLRSPGFHWDGSRFRLLGEKSGFMKVI